MRTDGRKPRQLRSLTITPGYLKTADGSVLIEVGDTKVICTAKLEERVPLLRKNCGTRSSSFAVQMTFVSPTSINTEPSAVFK